VSRIIVSRHGGEAIAFSAKACFVVVLGMLFLLFPARKKPRKLLGTPQENLGKGLHTPLSRRFGWSMMGIQQSRSMG
jgi:hypothetical protein